MQNVDTIINAEVVLPFSPANVDQELQHHSVVINAGKIVDILPIPQARQRYRAEHTYDLTHHAVLPGLINCHTHAAMNLLRGIADDLPLQTWLEKHIWPLEGQYVSEDFVYVGTQLAIAEMLKNGITTFNDMYFYPGSTIEAARESGMRAVIAINIMNIPTRWAKDEEESLKKGWECYETYRNELLTHFALAPHAVYTVSEKMLRHIAELSTAHQLPVNIHLQETAQEVLDWQTKNNMRPLAYLDQLGLVNNHLLAVHMTQLEAEEIALLATKKANVVTCPQSNMKLASGYCPVSDLLASQVNVAIGTDGAASNNNLDLLEEVRITALLAKLMTRNPQSVSATQALTLATIGGAKALGLESQIGSLEIDKAADLIAIDLKDVNNLPGYHVIADLVYSSSTRQTRYVWVAGQCLLSKGELTTIDEEYLFHRVSEWREKLSK